MYLALGTSHECLTSHLLRFCCYNCPLPSQGTEACFSDLSCLLPAKLTNSEDTLVYVSSMNSQTIRSYNPKTGEVRHVLGNGRRGPHTDGSLEDPFGMAVDSKGRLIISCLEGYTILRYDPSQPAEKQLDCLAGRSGTRWFRDGASFFILMNHFHDYYFPKIRVWIGFGDFLFV